MIKYARVVLEVEVADDASNDEILDDILDNATDWLLSVWGIDDVEIHETPYIKD